MKKILIAAAAVTMLLGPVVARAQDTMGGLGFRTNSDPGSGILGVDVSPTIGIRQWFSPRFGVDLGVGFATLNVESGPPTITTDEATGFSFDVGVPVSAKKWDRVNFIFRPGFQYGSVTLKDPQDPTPPNEVKAATLVVSGELEVEYMLVDKLSISASHGIAYRSIKITDNGTPQAETKLTGFNTGGNNFTQLGFHVYLW